MNSIRWVKELKCSDGHVAMLTNTHLYQEGVVSTELARVNL